MHTSRGSIDTGAAHSADSTSIQRHLLVIGIDEYSQPGVAPLNNAVADATAFQQVLQDQYGYSPERSICLINEVATYEATHKALVQILTTAGPHDDVVIYFAGHGHYDSTTSSGYWYLYDSQAEQIPSMYPNQLVKNLMKNSRARHIFSVVDSCFSGGLFVERSLSPTAQRLYSIPSRWVMTSGLIEPVSDGKKGAHSPFAHSLLAALRGQTAVALGITQLWQLMRDGVIANAAQTPRCEPLQSANHMGGEMYFIKSGEQPPAAITQLAERTPAVFTDATGNEFLLEIDELEKAGLQRQAKLLMRKLQAVQEALILETNADQQFRYQMLIEKDQQKLNALQDQLTDSSK